MVCWKSKEAVNDESFPIYKLFCWNFVTLNVENHIEQQCLSIKNDWANASLYFYIGLKIRSTSKPHSIVPGFEIFGIFHFNKNKLSLVWRLLSFEHLRIPFILGFLILWKFDQWFYNRNRNIHILQAAKRKQ